MEKLVTVAAYDTSSKAQTMKLLLEDQGIEVFLADENIVGIDWLLANAIGGIKLQVRVTQSADARAFLERQTSRFETSKSDVPLPPVAFKCSECGKQISFPGKRRGGVETCPFCKQYVDVPETDTLQ